MCQKLLQPSLIIPADFGNNKMSFQAYTILKIMLVTKLHYGRCKECQFKNRTSFESD